MTYPPQQPGPYGQQGPWGQQPQTPLPPQTPPWLTDDGFPSFEPDPRTPRRGRAAALVIVGLLVLAGGGFGVWLLMSRESQGAGSGESDARSVAERYVRDIERTVNTPIADIDIAALEPVTCDGDFTQMEREIADLKEDAPQGESEPSQPRVEIGMKDFQTTGDTASFTLTQSSDLDVKGQNHKMTMAKENGRWTVCGLFDRPSSPSSPPAEPADPADPDTDETITVTATQVVENPDGAPSSGAVPNPIPTR
ncbi:Rv0361 family membrane protein [Actinophytocola xanthii]|uniref:DUF4878 domain-containing protein n=1 Tax=Actinophytocola xanthii TaxID=1912961 RepID=A0A1Q8CUU9_9PSEU|nr:hypothetical protein [Actinophytocola xanthii]OLF18094.1 hypothetical protein BU204_08100 [Actinophytocola xanthii]